MRQKILLVVGCLAALLAGACASTRKAARELSAGSCQSECAEKHPDSLYDRNRCLGECSPP